MNKYEIFGGKNEYYYLQFTGLFLLLAIVIVVIKIISLVV